MFNVCVESNMTSSWALYSYEPLTVVIHVYHHAVGTLSQYALQNLYTYMHDLCLLHLAKFTVIQLTKDKNNRLYKQPEANKPKVDDILEH